jgi:hypothetical protein
VGVAASRLDFFISLGCFQRCGDCGVHPFCKLSGVSAARLNIYGGAAQVIECGFCGFN